MARIPAMRTRTECRLCGAKDLIEVLRLGSTPLANEFVSVKERDIPQDRFPLQVHLCRACHHVQLLDVVDPERLFRQYVYVSATSPVFVEHFRRYAGMLLGMTGMPAGSQVMDIGSNDGTLLRFFLEAGMQVLGIDPAQAIAAEATKSGIPTLPEFFDLAVARRLRAEGWQPTVVTANNVFAHADDLQTMVEGIVHLLAPEGLFVFEVSYLLDVVEQTLFDTIYHEHLSYHTVKPLVGFFARHGMELIDVIRVESHGGSLRGIAKRAGGKFAKQPSVEQLCAQESARGLHGPEAFRALGERIQQRKVELTHLLTQLKGEGKRIVGFGAPAKATTLLYAFGLGPETLDYVIDESPWKQGLLTPGHHLPVVASTALYEASRKPDYAVILAWNFAEAIRKKHQAFREAGGHFIVPLPTVEVY